MQSNLPLPAQDLEHVLTYTEEIWNEIRGKRVFLTGGTGFFGSWLAESFAAANERFSLKAELLVLSRDPGAFTARIPHLAASPSVKVLKGDTRDFDWPEKAVDVVIHGAAPASAALNREDGLLMADTIIDGTRNVLDMARAKGVSRFLFISSGAVYGKQPSHIRYLDEEYNGGPNTLDPDAAYGEAKRMAELFCSAYHRYYGIPIVIARCFAFVGPRLNLDIHFAIGNFIRDGLKGGPIIVKGDGTPLRSYLYTADLAIWLWTMLTKGEPGGAYNVGSEEAISIAELARTVARCFTPEREVTILGKRKADDAVEQYVPSTTKARTQLRLTQHIDLSIAIARTIAWYSIPRD